MKKVSLRPFALSLLILPFLISGAEQHPKRSFSFSNAELVLVAGAKIVEPSTFACQEDQGHLALATPAETSLAKAQGFNGFVFGQAGEDALTTACQQLITTNTSNYEIGAAVATPSFNLRDKGYKNIIHSPAPRREWYPTEKEQNDRLTACYSNILTVVRQLGLKGVATVPFGTGVAGYTHNDSARLLAGAIYSLQQASGDSKRIYVIYGNAADLETAATAVSTFQHEHEA